MAWELKDRKAPEFRWSLAGRNLGQAGVSTGNPGGQAESEIVQDQSLEHGLEPGVDMLCLLVLFDLVLAWTDVRGAHLGMWVGRDWSDLGRCL